MPVVGLATTEAVEAVPPQAGVDLHPARRAGCRAAPAPRRTPSEARAARRAARAAALARYGLGRFLDDWDALLAGGGDVDEDRHGVRAREPTGSCSAESTPAGRTSTSPRCAGAAGAGSAPRWSCTRGATTRRLPRRVRDLPRRRGRPRRGRPGPVESRRTTCCPTCRAFAAGLRERPGASTPPDVVHAHFWMSGLAALTPRRPGTSPSCRPSTRSARVKRRHQAEADTSPAGRMAAERCSHATPTASSPPAATRRSSCSGWAPTAGGSRSFRAASTCGASARTARPTARWPGITGCVASAAWSSARASTTSSGAAVAAEHCELVIAGGRLGRAAWTPIRRPRVCAGSRDGSVWQTGSSCAGAPAALPSPRAPALGRRGRAARPGTSRSGSCRSRRWPAACRSSRRRSAGCSTDRPWGAGLLVPPRCPEAIAAALRELLGDERRRVAMGRAIDRTRRRYSWETVAEAILDTYTSLQQPAAVRARSSS